MPMEHEEDRGSKGVSGRKFLSWLWTPLVVVTAATGVARSGQVAVSAHGASIVPDRPRISVGLWKGNLTRDLVERSGAFAVHLLRDDQDDLVYHFGLQSGATVDKFRDIELLEGSTGSPLLRDCLAWFECRVVAQMDAGDHTVFLGDVINSEARSEGEPLWWRDLRPRMPPELQRRWEEQTKKNVATSLKIMDTLL